MGIHYTKKGKFFTQIISKNPIQAIFQTLTHRIVGNVHVRQGDRLIDELTASTQFLAVTEATVYNSSGKEIYTTDFMAINRDHVVWLLPLDEAGETQTATGDQA